jgi:nucleoid-associated protein EbfC
MHHTIKDLPGTVIVLSSSTAELSCGHNRGPNLTLTTTRLCPQKYPLKRVRMHKKAAPITPFRVPERASSPAMQLSLPVLASKEHVEQTSHTRIHVSVFKDPMNFSDLGKMKEMMSQAREMQTQMEQKLAETIVEADSGGGMVSVRMNGKKEVLRVKIEPTALGASTGDIELLEDLIAAAFNEAGRRADEAMKSSVAGMMGGLNLPGLSE